jgi:UDP-N-acetylglucosamine 2-epimerase (non-hydrolysing)
MAIHPIIAVLLGTRPEAIKLAPVISGLRGLGLPVAVIGTGQHQELAEQALDLFGIELDEDLALMRPGQTLDHLLAGTITAVGELIDVHRPQVIVVQGDTTSTLGSSIAAFHRHVPVAHVEAGLRTHDLDYPFPEEMNRRATSVMARWHFAPTPRAAANLAAEGVEDRVHVVGNTVVDALRHILATEPPIPPEIAAFIDGHPFILATAHRRESWDGGIAAIARALRDVIDDLADHRLVFVTHPNPLARAPVTAALQDHSRAMIAGPLPYSSFLALLSRARLAVSDSGGIQEEGPTLGVPVLVTRATTERPEGVEAGAVRLVGTDTGRITSETRAILTDPPTHAAMSASGRSIYGDGQSGQRIAAILREDFLPG